MTTRVPPPRQEDTAWMARAACRGMDLRRFYPTLASQHQDALNVCEGCPVRDECLEYDMRHDTGHMHGVWGGLTERQRRSLQRARVRVAQERAGAA